MKLPVWLQSVGRWPAWKIFLAALLIGLLLGVSWQCSKRGATDFFTASPADPAVPAADTVPLPAVGAVPGQNGGVLDALPPRVAPSRPAPTPPSDTAATTAAVGGNDAGAPHPVNSVAVAISSPPPVYPADAVRMNQQGTVVLRVGVEADGSTSDIEIEESSGSRPLDRAARMALRRWQFQPAYREGVAIRSDVRVPVKFNLQK